MSRTERCLFCTEFHDTEEYPELRGVCLDCWHKIQQYLTDRGITMVQGGGGQ